MQLLALFSYQLQQNIQDDEAPTKLVYPTETQTVPYQKTTQKPPDQEQTPLRQVTEDAALHLGSRLTTWTAPPILGTPHHRTACLLQVQQWWASGEQKWLANIDVGVLAAGGRHSSKFKHNPMKPFVWKEGLWLENWSSSTRKFPEEVDFPAWNSVISSLKIQTFKLYMLNVQLFHGTPCISLSVWIVTMIILLPVI